MAKEKKNPEDVEENRTVDVLRQIRSEKGSEAYGIQMLEATMVESVPRSPTGVFSVDLATGGGYPLGRIIEIFGNESSGKTTLTLHGISEVQKRGNIAAFIDLEHAYNPAYGKALGVDPAKLLFSQPDSAEVALNLADHLCDYLKSGDMIVIDSVAALVPEAELNGEMGDSHMGLQARLMGQALRMLTHKISASNIVVIFINQLRQKIGVVYGNPDTTTGGNALKFYASLRLEVKSGTKLKGKNEKDPPVGQVTHIKVVKNKVSMPFKNTDVDLYYGWGFLPAADVFLAGKSSGVIEASGSWYSYKENRIGQGEVQAKEFLSQNPEIQEEIKKSILEKLGGSYC